MAFSCIFAAMQTDMRRHCKHRTVIAWTLPSVLLPAFIVESIHAHHADDTPATYTSPATTPMMWESDDTDCPICLFPFILFTETSLPDLVPFRFFLTKVYGRFTMPTCAYYTSGHQLRSPPPGNR